MAYCHHSQSSLFLTGRERVERKETLILRGGIAPSPSGPLAPQPGTLPYKMYGDPPVAGEKSTASSGTSGGTDPRGRCLGRPVEYGGRACTLSACGTPNPAGPAGHGGAPIQNTCGPPPPRRGCLGSGSSRPTASVPGLHTKPAAPSTSRGGLCRRGCSTKPHFSSPGDCPHIFCMGGPG